MKDKDNDIRKRLLNIINLVFQIQFWEEKLRTRFPQFLSQFV